MSKRPPKNGKIIETKQTLLIDGNALFKVGFFGAKNEYNHKGQHIGGLYSFLTILRKILNENLIHRVYVFWDGKFSGKLRYNIYKPYKSGRGKDYINGTESDQEEMVQKMMIWNYLEELCIRQLQHEFVESDDFIAYYCKMRDENEKITICTNDRDMCQLINEDVRIYFFDLKTYVDNINYSSYFCHHFENSSLIKTIVGDNSDTIKGIKGVKETTLVSLFPEIKTRKTTLSEIIQSAIKIQEERIKEKKKPLKTLDNIINSVTDGPQGKNIYQINSMLVDLKNPLITEDAIMALNDLKDGKFNTEERTFKNVISYIKNDGLETSIGKNRFEEFLLPFKKLLGREKNLLID